ILKFAVMLVKIIQHHQHPLALFHIHGALKQAAGAMVEVHQAVEEFPCGFVGFHSLFLKFFLSIGDYTTSGLVPDQSNWRQQSPAPLATIWPAINWPEN